MKIQLIIAIAVIIYCLAFRGVEDAFIVYTILIITYIHNTKGEIRRNEEKIKELINKRDGYKNK